MLGNPEEESSDAAKSEEAVMKGKQMDNISITDATDNTIANDDSQKCVNMINMEDSDSDDEPLIIRKTSTQISKNNHELCESETGDKPQMLQEQSQVDVTNEENDEHKSDSDDDEPIIMRRKGKKSNITDSASVDSEDEDAPAPVSSPLTDSEDEDQKLLVSTKKKGRRRCVLEDDSDMEDEAADTKTDPCISNVSNSNDHKNSTERMDTETKGSTLFSGDLFDAEEDSDGHEDSEREKKEEENEEGVTRDEGFGDSDDEEEDGEKAKDMSAKLKKLLAKGAAKKEKSGRGSEPRKSKQNALMEIHSESQRLMRESSLKLPYHKPKPLSLSALLAKTQQKQSQLHSLKKIPGWKNSPELQSLQKAASEPRRSSKSRKQESGVDIKKPQDTEQLSTQANCPTEVMTRKSSVGIPEDELPDLGSVVRDISNALDEASEKTESGKTKKVVEDAVVDESKSITEQDSGILVTPATSSEEENSEDTRTQSNNNYNEDNNIEEVVDIACTPTNTEEEKPNVQSSVTTLTPKLLGLVVDSVKPCLSGDPDSFIDLDEVEEEMATPKPEGIGDLMSRLMKHSKSSHKKARDVELSTVTMEKGKNDREELKLEKLVYHIEGDEVIDPKLNKPGAKLTALKETLSEQMKVKREEARQKRCELYELDNEEGFDNEVEDEEAELTDQTDTDVEEEEVDEEEELDEEEYGADEVEKKGDNPFVDDEAEDEDNDIADDDDDDDDTAMDADDEDGEDEESMKLELDVQDKESLNGAEEEEEKDMEERKDFLKAALLKTNTLTLFDEETIYDAPSLSQKEKEEIPEVSDRPFEQLSGNSVKAADSDGHDDMPDTQPIADVDKGFVPVMDESSATNMSLLKDKDTSISSVDTSFDVMGSLIPAGQPAKGTARKYGRNTPDLFTPSSKSSVNTTCSTLSKPQRALSELTLPIEDSQDLYNSPPIRSSQAESTPRLDSQSFHFAFEDDTQSQLLDAEGFFKVKSTEKKSVKRQLNLGENGNSQDMDELLGLCSGKFREAATQRNPGDKSSRPVVPGAAEPSMDTQGNMDELLGLCSGKFASEKTAPQEIRVGLQASIAGKFAGPKNTQENLDDLLPLCSGKFSESTQAKKGKKRKPVIEDDDSQDSFIVGSVDETSDKEENLDSDEEMERENEEDKENVDDIVKKKGAASFKGFKGKRGGIRKEWLEDEAELSGSEYDSDENFDLDENDDIMEEEEGDYDQDVLSDEELRNQVGRVHLKTMLDSDDKQILLYKEMYLPDGDLHSEGGGRMRRFRWKNIDDMSQTDMFGKDSDDEKEDEETEQENKWRLERHQREKFLEEQKAKELDVDEGSQLLKLGKVIFKPKKDIASVAVQDQTPKPAPREKSTAPKAIFKVPKNNKGSFLTRSKEALAKIAEMTKPVTNPNGPRNSRNFVFSSVNPDEVEEKKVKTMQRSTSIDGSKPPRKRPRLERSNTLSQDSIFNLF